MSLSGECKFSREFRRGNWAIAKQHQVFSVFNRKECVKRRALIGLEAAPHCRGDVGKEAMQKVWESCFADTAPFDEIY